MTSMNVYASAVERLNCDKTDISSAAILSTNALIHVVTATSTNYACRLNAFRTNEVHIIRNVGAYPALIFPLNGVSNINGDTNGTGLWIASNGECKVVVDTNDNTDTLSTRIIKFLMIDKSGVPVIDLTDANQTLFASESGSVFNLAPAAGGARTITMPAPTARGLRYRLTLPVVNNTNAITIDCGAGKLFGQVIQRNAAGTGSPNIAASGRNVVLSAVCPAGTIVDLTSNGTMWMCTAVVPANNDTAQITIT